MGDRRMDLRLVLKGCVEHYKPHPITHTSLVCVIVKQSVHHINNCAHSLKICLCEASTVHTSPCEWPVTIETINLTLRYRGVEAFG